jgi:enoyl-CoA hydratase
VIITGRPVGAAEALQFGLVNRVVPRGRAREAGQQLAAQIAALPLACLRSDRMSALESVWLDDREAMAGEFRHGLVILGRSEDERGRRAVPGGCRPRRRRPGCQLTTGTACIVLFVRGG